MLQKRRLMRTGERERISKLAMSGEIPRSLSLYVADAKEGKRAMCETVDHVIPELLL